MADLIDITPNPRILRTLGEIPFQPWQCMAELIDNSVDAFAEMAPSPDRWKERSRTLPGIAAAMAEQWGI